MPLAAGARDAILAASLKSFARDGFNGASIPKIAELAKVAHPLIHYYFGSKDKLWRATVAHYLGDEQREAAAILAATRGLPPLDRLRVVLRSFTQFAARFPDHFAMIVAEARSQSERFSWLQDHYGRRYMDEIKALLTAAQEAGQLRDAPVDHVASILIGPVLVYFTVNPVLPKDVESSVLADEFADTLFDMLLNGFALNSPAMAANGAKAPGRSRRRAAELRR